MGEGNEGGYGAVIQGGEEGIPVFRKAGKNVGEAVEPEGMGGELRKFRVVAYKDFCQPGSGEGGGDKEEESCCREELQAAVKDVGEFFLFRAPYW